MPETLVDNDIVLKLCKIKYLGDLAACLGSTDTPLLILGSLRFVLGPLVAQHSDSEMQALFVNFLSLTEAVEPSDAEVILAARLAEAAMRMGQAVDGGEALLFAVAVIRSARIVTGDKRAVKGLSAIENEERDCVALRGAVVTLEWVVSSLIARHGIELVRRAVCEVPGSDKTLCICFRCQSHVCTQDDVIDALESYQRRLSHETGGFVAPTLAF